MRGRTVVTAVVLGTVVAVVAWTWFLVAGLLCLFQPLTEEQPTGVCALYGRD